MFVSELGSHFGTICLKRSSDGAFAFRFWFFVFRNLSGSTLGPILAYPRAPLVWFSSWKTILLQISKISKQHFDTSWTNGTNHTSPKHLKKNVMNPNKIVFTLPSNKPAQVRNLDVFKLCRWTPEGITIWERRRWGSTNIKIWFLRVTANMEWYEKYQSVNLCEI